MHFDHSDFVRTYLYENCNFKFINTFEPFMDFYRDHDRNDMPTINTNNRFWNDFYQYLNFNPNKGKYDTIQLDSLIIVIGYRKTESGFTFVGVENHGIVVPENNYKKIGGSIMEDPDQDLINFVVCRGCHDDYHKEATRDGYCLTCYEERKFEDENFDE